MQRGTVILAPGTSRGHSFFFTCSNVSYKIGVLLPILVVEVPQFLPVNRETLGCLDRSPKGRNIHSRTLLAAVFGFGAAFLVGCTGGSSSQAEPDEEAVIDSPFGPMETHRAAPGFDPNARL